MTWGGLRPSRNAGKYCFLAMQAELELSYPETLNPKRLYWGPGVGFRLKQIKDGVGCRMVCSEGTYC